MMQDPYYDVYENRICKNCIYYKECEHNKYRVIKFNDKITIKCNKYELKEENN